MISAIAPEAVGSPMSTHVRMSDVSILAIAPAASAEASPPMQENNGAVGSEATVTLRKASSINKWSPYTETIFQQLVAKRAEGRLTPEDHERIAKLRDERERLASPVPAEQVLRDFKARQLRREALEAMRKYADFLEKSARKTKSRSQA